MNLPVTHRRAKAARCFGRPAKKEGFFEKPSSKAWILGRVFRRRLPTHSYAAVLRALKRGPAVELGSGEVRYVNLQSYRLTSGFLTRSLQVEFELAPTPIENAAHHAPDSVFSSGDRDGFPPLYVYAFRGRRTVAQFMAQFRAFAREAFDSAHVAERRLRDVQFGQAATNDSGLHLTG